MYHDEFGTDWDTVSVDEAITRAYALGVADSLGEGDPEEYNRLCEAVSGRYNRSLVELAYQRGRGHAREHTQGGSDDAVGDRVWSDLVIEIGDEPTDVRLEEGLPHALARLPALDPPGDGLDGIRIPRFLLRE